MLAYFFTHFSVAFIDYSQDVHKGLIIASKTLHKGLIKALKRPHSKDKNTLYDCSCSENALQNTATRFRK